jgi:hypothetical protein
MTDIDLLKKGLGGAAHTSTDNTIDIFLATFMSLGATFTSPSGIDSGIGTEPEPQHVEDQVAETSDEHIVEAATRIGNDQAEVLPSTAGISDDIPKSIDVGNVNKLEAPHADEQEDRIDGDDATKLGALPNVGQDGYDEATGTLRFTINISRNSTEEKLGIRMLEGERRVIETIEKAGLIDKWNLDQNGQDVKVGDVIVLANGSEEFADMDKILHTADDLEISFRRQVDHNFDDQLGRKSWAGVAGQAKQPEASMAQVVSKTTAGEEMLPCNTCNTSTKLTALWRERDTELWHCAACWEADTLPAVPKAVLVPDSSNRHVSEIPNRSY